MKLVQYEALRAKMHQESFENSFRSIDRVLFYCSYIGNALSIIFAFVFLNSIVGTIEPLFNGQHVVLAIILLLLLFCFEYVKRLVTHQLIFNVLRTQMWLNSKILLGMSILVCLLFASFYTSLNGAKQTVDRTTEIQGEEQVQRLTLRDSVFNHYQSQIQPLLERVDFVFEAAKNSKRSLWRTEREDVQRWESQILVLEQARDKELDEIEQQVSLSSSQQLEEVYTSQVVLIVISVFIELLILLGVIFNVVYLFFSFKEFEQQLKNNPTYSKYLTFIQLLSLWTQNGYKRVGENLATRQELKQLIQSRQLSIPHSTYEEFYTVCTHLNITTLQGKQRKLQMEFEQAKFAISQYLLL